MARQHHSRLWKSKSGSSVPLCQRCKEQVGFDVSELGACFAFLCVVCEALVYQELNAGEPGCEHGVEPGLPCDECDAYYAMLAGKPKLRLIKSRVAA